MSKEAAMKNYINELTCLNANWEHSVIYTQVEVYTNVWVCFLKSTLLAYYTWGASYI